MEHFLALLGRQMGRDKAVISPAALAALQQYDFPGNVRELRNMVEYTLIASRGGTITPVHLPFSAEAVTLPVPATPLPLTVVGSEQDEQCILDYVREHQRIDNNGVQSLLHIAHSRASYLLKKLHRIG